MPATLTLIGFVASAGMISPFFTSPAKIAE